MPWRRPTISPTAPPAPSAASTTPASVRLMTAVGPPDWPTTSAPLTGTGGLLAHARGGRDRRLAQGLHDRPQEVRQVVRRARGDKVAGADAGLVAPDAAGVHHIVLDRSEPGDGPASDYVGRAEHPAGVADRGDQFALLVRLADEGDHGRAAPHEIGGVAARDHDQVELARIDGIRLGIDL